jgi:CBS domain containing-hemolysin-like protein
MDEGSFVFDATYWTLVGLAGAAALIHVTIRVVLGARQALGRLTSARILEDAGVDRPLNPGSRLWITCEVLRATTLVAIPLLLAATRWHPVAFATGGALALILGARLATDLTAPRWGESLLRASARPLRVLDAVLGPLVAPLAHLWVRTPERNGESPEMDEDEREEQIEEVIRDAEDSGLLEREQGELFREIVDLGAALVREVMTPRTDIDAIEAETTSEEAAQEFIRCLHSRLPVYEESLDRVVGVISVRDVLPFVHAGGDPVPVREIMRPVPLVPETKNALELLRELQNEQNQMAVVVDEYGGTAGLVTVEDLVEEIVGEIRDEHEVEEDEVQPDGRGGYVADGLLTVDDLEELLDVEIDSDGVDTVGGLVFSQLGRIPRVGETVSVSDDVVIEVVAMRGRRIARVRFRRLTDVAASTEERQKR